jgi:hypothetical protein
MTRYLALLVLFVVLLVGAAMASGQGPITVTRSDAIPTFQKDIRFSMDAQGDNAITSATLHFRLADQKATNSVDVEIAPGHSISAEHSWDLTGADLPSGTVITYWWTIEDNAGNAMDTEKRSFVYEDSRYTWKKLTGDGVTLAWYKGDDAFGRSLLDSAVSASRRLASEFSVDRKPATIYIYGSQQDLLRGIGESAQEWTGGRAYPDFNTVLIGVASSDLRWGQRAVAHEFAHLIVSRATSNPFSDVPRWLDEGLAMWAEGDLEPDYRSALNQAIKNNQLLSLQTMSSNFPADSRQASVAYAESYAIIEYIRSTFGRQKLDDMLKAFKEGSTADAVLKSTFGVTTNEMDAQWRASLGLPPGSLDAPPATPASALPARVVAVIGFGMLAATLAIFASYVVMLVIVLKT